MALDQAAPIAIVETDQLHELEAERARDVWDLRVFGYANPRPRWARFVGRADRSHIGATRISQGWLLEVAKEWAFRAALRRVHGSKIDSSLQSLALLSSTLRARPDLGEDPRALDRRDIDAFLVRVQNIEAKGLHSSYTVSQFVGAAMQVLEDVRTWGLDNADEAAAGLATSFAFRRDDSRPRSNRSPDAPSHALPRTVVRQLLHPTSLAVLRDVGGAQTERWVRLALDTGRRPGELINLPLDGCLDYNVFTDEAGAERRHPVLVHDMPKVRVTDYRLPLTAATAALIEEQRAEVLARFPTTPRARLPLFPAAHHNPTGEHAVRTWQIGALLRAWLDQLGDLNAPATHEDGRAPSGDSAVFPRSAVYAYAFRHTWAQEHADAGTPLEVLQDLMGHAKPTTTQVYYRVTHERRRTAVTRLSQLQLTNTGTLAQAALVAADPAELARTAVGSTAVPYGSCVEPSNVQAGGHACPFRMRCPGCAYFRTDPSYLPDLNEYLTQLLVSRERVLATTQLEDWARASALPADEEIERVRTLIRRCEEELESLTGEERTEIEEYIAIARRSRSSVASAIPIRLLGVVRAGDPDLFPVAMDRLTGAPLRGVGEVR